MASLKDLLDELADLTVRPSEINIPRKVFKAILSKAQDITEEDEDGEVEE